MDKDFEKHVRRLMENLYTNRKIGVLTGDFTEEEADKTIADVAKEYKEKYDNMTPAEMAVEMMGQILEHSDEAKEALENKMKE